MISEQGIVQEIKAGTAIVKIQKSAACNHCESKGSCDISNREMIVEVYNELGATAGDLVEVSVPEGAIIKLSLLVYFFPVIALLIGAFLGNYLSRHLETDPSLTSIVVGGICMGAVFFFLKKVDRSRKSTGNNYPRMTRILSNVTVPQPCDNISDRI